MFGYVTFNLKYYILSQIFYKKNRVSMYTTVYLLIEQGCLTVLKFCPLNKLSIDGTLYLLLWTRVLMLFFPVFARLMYPVSLTTWENSPTLFNYYLLFA